MKVLLALALFAVAYASELEKSADQVLPSLGSFGSPFQRQFGQFGLPYNPFNNLYNPYNNLLNPYPNAFNPLNPFANAYNPLVNQFNPGFGFNPYARQFGFQPAFNPLAVGAAVRGYDAGAGGKPVAPSGPLNGAPFRAQ